MIEETKVKRPLIAIFLALLLCLKLLSGLGVLYNLSGLTLGVVVIQLCMIAWCAVTMNTRGGGVGKIKAMICFIFITMILDLLVIYLMLGGRDVPNEIYPRVIGAEITYVITIVYLYFSKKLKIFKAGFSN